MHAAACRTSLIRPYRRSRRAAGVAVLIAIGGLCLTSKASAQVRLPVPILKAVIKVDGDLQVGIEEAPAVLIRELASSSMACGNALEAEQTNGSAQPSWTTLSQIVERGDLPARRAITGALSKSHSDLGELRALLAGRWHDRFANSHELVPAITQAQKGIDGLRIAVKSFGVAFERWEEHDCAGAQEAIAATNRRIPPAVALINKGMKRLTAALL